MPPPAPLRLRHPALLLAQAQAELMSKDLMAGLKEVEALIRQLPEGGGSEADEVAQASRRWSAGRCPSRKSLPAPGQQQCGTGQQGEVVELAMAFPSPLVLVWA